MPPYSLSVRRTKRPLLFFVLLLLLITIPGANGNRVSGQLQPILLELAATEPDSTVAVIVQLHPAASAITSALAYMGGKQTKDLHIINAIVAELPARQLPALANLAAVRWISLDAPVVETGCTECVPTKNLRTVYNQAIGADQLWNKPLYLQGNGIGVAVLDSGIQNSHADFAGRIVAGKSTVFSPKGYDGYGHGTFVAGLIGGDGRSNKSRYIGVAPQSNLIDVKVTTLAGASTESDVVEGLQWVYENREAYNIRVVNLSLNTSQAQSYHTSPLSAVCEILWFNGIVVVTSAGNRGEGTIYPPANDPFVITVGATDDMATATIADDTVAHFSAYGSTIDGFAKPDLVAPGRHIVGPLASSEALLPMLHPEMKVDGSYMQMSGTSAAAPIVSGAIALLLQQEPHLTPDQVKYRLLTTANRIWPGYDVTKAGAGYLDIATAVHNKSTESANTGLAMSHLLTNSTAEVGRMDESPLSLNWDSVSWSSVSWSSVSWSSDYIEGQGDLTDMFSLFSRAGEDDLTLLSEDAANGTVNTSNETLSNHLYLPIVLSDD